MGVAQFQFQLVYAIKILLHLVFNVPVTEDTSYFKAKCVKLFTVSNYGTYLTWNSNMSVAKPLRRPLTSNEVDGLSKLACLILLKVTLIFWRTLQIMAASFRRLLLIK